MRLKFLVCLLIVTSTLLTACETMTSSKRVAVATADKWALLPIENLSKTPLAGDRAQALVETHLRARGINNLDLYQPTSEQSLLALLDEAGQMNTAMQWAKDNGYRFAVTGNVQEWEYKDGLDNEPSVGLSLKVIDLYRDEVLWLASGSRTGWGYTNLSSVASKTIRELLSEVRFKHQQSIPAGKIPVARVNPPASVVPSLLSALPPAPPMTGEPRIEPLPTALDAEPEMGAAQEAPPENAVPQVFSRPLLLPSPYENNEGNN